MWLKLLHSCTWTCYEGCQATPRGRSVLCRQQVKVTYRQSRTGSKIIPIRWSIIIVIFFFFLYLCLSLSAFVKYYKNISLPISLSLIIIVIKVIWTEYIYRVHSFSHSLFFSLCNFLTSTLSSPFVFVPLFLFLSLSAKELLNYRFFGDKFSWILKHFQNWKKG